MIKIIAYTTEVSGSAITIRDSEGESVCSSDVNELINFLNEPYSDKSTFAIKVFFDMDTTLAPILKLLGTSACKILAGPTHTYKDLFYITSKIFVIDREQKSFFYHLKQYYIDDPEPEDAETIAVMAQVVMDAYHQMGLNPKKLTSPVAVYEAEVLKHMQIPNILNIPGDHEEIVEYAENCLGLPDNLHFWIQNYQIGHWNVGEIFEYDIRSSFPYVASKLRSLQYAKYAKSPCIQPEADWGYMKGIVTIHDDVKVSPIFDEDGEQRTGTFPAWITLHDYLWLRKWEVGDFKLDTGYFIKFTAPVTPMEIPLKRLFNQRGAGGMVNNLAKRISTSVGFGKMLEKHDDGTVGDFYNPPYAAMIVSIGNLQVAEFIYKNKLQDHLVHVGVDSVAATKEVELPIRWGMGTWKLNGIGPMLVLSAGRVYHGDKKPQGMNYNQITKMIESKPRETYYTTKLRRRQTLDESIQMGDLNGLGRLKLTSSSIDLNLLRASQDRLFKKFPNNGGELLSNQYQSEPLKSKIFSEISPK